MAMTYGSIDKPKIITVILWGGIVTRVEGMPKGYVWDCIDEYEHRHDDDLTDEDKDNEEEE